MSHYYEINVTRNRHNFFSTTPHTITTAQALKQVLPVIVSKFPKVEGYDIDVTRHDEIVCVIRLPLDCGNTRPTPNLRLVR